LDVGMQAGRRCMAIGEAATPQAYLEWLSRYRVPHELRPPGLTLIKCGHEPRKPRIECAEVALCRDFERSGRAQEPEPRRLELQQEKLALLMRAAPPLKEGVGKC